MTLLVEEILKVKAKLILIMSVLAFQTLYVSFLLSTKEATKLQSLFELENTIVFA